MMLRVARSQEIYGLSFNEKEHRTPLAAYSNCTEYPWLRNSVLIMASKIANFTGRPTNVQESIKPAYVTPSTTCTTLHSALRLWIVEY